MRKATGLLLLALAASASAQADPCAPKQDCTSCIDTVGCGWCSTGIIFDKGGVGPRCAGPKFGEKFTCNGIYSTDQCVQGYKCNKATQQCEMAAPGEGETKDDCELECNGASTDVFTCDTDLHQCIKAQPGTPGAVSLDVCKKQCPNQTPPPTPPTPPKPPKPGALYKCDIEQLQCSEVAPGTPGSTGDKAACDASCKKRPPSPGPPPDLVNTVWRGLFVENDYTPNEVGVKFTDLDVEIVVGGSLYLQGPVLSNLTGMFFTVNAGTASTLGDQIPAIIEVEGQGPETQIAVLVTGKPNGVVPTDKDAAIKGNGNRVLVLNKCLNPALCSFAVVQPSARRASSLSVRRMPLLPNAVSIANGFAAPVSDPCSVAQDCQSCLDLNPECGWCSTNVRYSSGQQGSQCAGVNNGITPFVCNGQYSTDTCLVGYKCDTESGQCVAAGPGEGQPLSECQKTCQAGPTPSPKPTPPTPPSPPKPPTPTEQYHCNYTTLQCEKTGELTQQACAGLCVKPTPVVPKEVQGVWRGIQIHGGYTPGEYDLSIGETTATLALDGAVQWEADVETYANVYLRFNLKSGKHQGQALNAFYQIAAQSYTQVDAVTMGFSAYGGDMPASFDAAMTAPNTEFVFVRCHEGSDCKFKEL